MPVYTPNWGQTQREMVELAEKVGGFPGAQLTALIKRLEAEFRDILRERNGIISACLELAYAVEAVNMPKVDEAINKLKAKGLLKVSER